MRSHHPEGAEDLDLGPAIREPFQQAVAEIQGPFSLKGRGREPRCTLDRRLAAFLRGVDLPHCVISGYGANRHYPERLVKRAAEILKSTMNRDVVRLDQGVAWVASE